MGDECVILRRNLGSPNENSVSNIFAMPLIRAASAVLLYSSVITFSCVRALENGAITYAWRSHAVSPGTHSPHFKKLSAPWFFMKFSTVLKHLVFLFLLFLLLY